MVGLSVEGVLVGHGLLTLALVVVLFEPLSLATMRVAGVSVGRTASQLQISSSTSFGRCRVDSRDAPQGVSAGMPPSHRQTG